MIGAAITTFACAAPAVADVSVPIRAQTFPVGQGCNLGGLSPAAALAAVPVAFFLAPDGVVVPGSLRLTGWNGDKKDAAEAASHSARHGLPRRGTLGLDLPLEQVEAWRDVELTFNPRRMEVS
ncbi:hypothetical protein [Vannielia litorea]|uniref:Uncharacterized protein n=1 Tax=Vannielia litorea TaxID=1217970 RepID=A0A1N6EA17_9RHOB|nr:hypothetical protein [Vannielia litorea]SIN79833.1 hypothetical protein SAMN05444002_0499 [Vannielia litorea]